MPFLTLASSGASAASGAFAINLDGASPRVPLVEVVGASRITTPEAYSAYEVFIRTMGGQSLTWDQGGNLRRIAPRQLQSDRHITSGLVTRPPDVRLVRRFAASRHTPTAAITQDSRTLRRVISSVNGQAPSLDTQTTTSVWFEMSDDTNGPRNNGMLSSDLSQQYLLLAFATFANRVPTNTLISTDTFDAGAFFTSLGKTKLTWYKFLQILASRRIIRDTGNGYYSLIAGKEISWQDFPESLITSEARGLTIRLDSFNSLDANGNADEFENPGVPAIVFSQTLSTENPQEFNPVVGGLIQRLVATGNGRATADYVAIGHPAALVEIDTTANAAWTYDRGLFSAATYDAYAQFLQVTQRDKTDGRETSEGGFGSGRHVDTVIADTRDLKLARHFPATARRTATAVTQEARLVHRVTSSLNSKNPGQETETTTSVWFEISGYPQGLEGIRYNGALSSQFAERYLLLAFAAFTQRVPESALTQTGTFDPKTFFRSLETTKFAWRKFLETLVRRGIIAETMDGYYKLIEGKEISWRYFSESQITSEARGLTIRLDSFNGLDATGKPIHMPAIVFSQTSSTENLQEPNPIVMGLAKKVLGEPS